VSRKQSSKEKQRG